MGCLVVMPAEHSTAYPTEPSYSLYMERVSSLKASAGGTRAGGAAQALTSVTIAPPVGPPALAGGDVGEPVGGLCHRADVGEPVGG